MKAHARCTGNLFHFGERRDIAYVADIVLILMHVLLMSPTGDPLGRGYVPLLRRSAASIVSMLGFRERAVADFIAVLCDRARDFSF
jgi:hypothetical protein